MSNNNVLLTGVPRSGTTLTCYLLNKLPDTVALHEPMRIRDLAESKNHEEIRLTVQRFFDEQRASIHTRKRARSRNVDGAVPDNSVGESRSEAGLRQSITSSEREIIVDKQLSQDFMLVVKHTSAFTTLLDILSRDFPVYALIRNPLATLSSWSSIAFKIRRGHASAAERLDPNLKARLAAIDDDLDRQIYLLNWFHGRFRRYLPERSIIRYESVIESGGRALSVVRPEASELNEPLESRNKSNLYDYQHMLRIGERLLNSEGAYWEFYTRESVERLLTEFDAPERSRRSPRFRFDRALSVAQNVKALLNPKKVGAARGKVAAPRKQKANAENPKDVQRPKSKNKNPRRAQRRANKRERLLEQMPTGGTCAEIGVWEGDFSARILEVNKPRSLHLVDPWKHESDEVYKSACYGGKKATDQEQMDAVYNRVAKRFAPQIQAGTVVIHRSPSAEAVSAFADGYFDWIYIDGNHLYEFVKLDLELWYPKVKSGGYITGDDYVEGRWWKGGVKKAVDEFAARIDRQPTILGKQFILKKS